MNARIIKNQSFLSNLYSIKHKAPQLHGMMQYRCQSCGKEWLMGLEVGVEDFGKNGRPHQPCPFIIPCECGGQALDISGCMSFYELLQAPSGMKYFAYDKSGKDDACGKMSIYISKEEKRNIK